MKQWSKSGGFWLGMIIVLQTIVYIVAGNAKVYIHMDEAYSLGLAQYDKFSVQDNADFYDHWHTREYYQDYLAVQEGERGDWRPVYENQKNDVHPPLYYLLLRSVLNLAPEEFSKWPGIILNIVIAVPVTILLYLITRQLLSKVKYAQEKALGLTLVATLTIAAISGVMYIRMYLLLTLWVLMTAWLHLKLVESETEKVSKWCILISVTALAGVLTQYYYLFFLLGAVIVMMVKYIRQKKWRDLKWYLGSLAAAGIVSLVIWPWSIEHMFLGYRGQGAMQTLLNIPQLLKNVGDYILLVDYYVFHRTLALWAIVGVISCFFVDTWLGPSLRASRRSFRSPLVANATKKQLVTPRIENGSVVFWSTVAYFLIVAAISPYIELRYILPVCGLILVLVLIGVGRVVGMVLREKAKDILMISLSAILVLAAPLQIGLGWMRIELLYRDRATVMEFAESHQDTPVIYFITTANNRFLDNILPFAIFEESYLALDWPQDAGRVQEILKGKNLEEGLVVFVSDQLEQEKYLEMTRQATKLEQVEFVQVLNTCSVYFLY